IGAGLGIYGVGKPLVSEFGFYPRVGFDLGHFFMSMDYNFIAVTNVKSGNETEYFGIRIGAFFFRGKTDLDN
ncbi:MAG: hypothetical protein NT126_04810, partial [Bacteroidetes bacterium]|nr:hypothetical protein [Bacteroidota bacterium]